MNKPQRALGSNFCCSWALVGWGLYHTLAPKGMIGPSHWPWWWRLFQALSPSITSILAAWHQWRMAYGHQCGGKPACSSAALVPSTTLRTVRSATPFVSGRLGVAVS